LRQITAKLWKFFLTPTDGISGHIYVSQSVVCEIVTVQERAFCVGCLFETKSVTQTQRNYRTQFNKQPPSDYVIRDWQRRFLETGSVHDRKRSGKLGVSDECVEKIRALQNPHVELLLNCYSHVQRYTKCYIIHNFLRPQVDFVDTLYCFIY
jgi:hypothetical protein